MVRKKLLDGEKKDEAAKEGASLGALIVAEDDGEATCEDKDKDKDGNCPQKDKEG